MSVSVSVNCNYCKRELRPGETYLHLFGRYERIQPVASKEDYTEQIIIKDNIRPFIVMCEDCRPINQWSDKQVSIKHVFKTVEKKGEED